MLRPLLATALLISGVTTVSIAPAAPVSALDDTPWTLPSTPPRCSTAEVASGDVGHCMVVFYGDPADTGWGTPPAPGVGDGWNWNGWTYSGSPALERWESTYIAANTTKVAGRPIGSLPTHVAARPLFEGFLDEISAKGYRVRDVGGYSFRCTSGNGGWKCPSGDPGDLSNHAWGLAIDMNAGTNPIRSYDGIDGRTACQTPMETDMPRWVVQTAEKWGLYWGGYGWNSGCQSTSTQRTRVYRDPPHFEFRGTPEQAAAIAAFNLGTDPSSQCFDVIDDAGVMQERCSASGVPQPGWRLAVQVEAPAGAVAALVNLTGTQAATPGRLTIEDCGPRSGERTTTSLSLSPGSAIATMAVAPLAENGSFCIWRSAASHSIVDVIGFLVEGEVAGESADDRVWVAPVEPTRVSDSRLMATCRPDGSCAAPGRIGDGGIRTIPTTDDAPRLVNVTTTRSNGWGWLQAGRCGEVGLDGDFSHLNYLDDGGARANLVLLQSDDVGACSFVFETTHVIVDELARLEADAGYGWEVGPAERVLDTRTCGATAPDDGDGDAPTGDEAPPADDDDMVGTEPAHEPAVACSGRLGAGDVIEIDLGRDVPAVAVAVTVLDTEAWGYASVAPCSELGAGTEPETSSVNHVAGQTATNLAITATDGGRFCVYSLTPADITIDLQAALVADHAVGLLPAGPIRAHDSRD